MAKASRRGVELLPLHRTDQEVFAVHADAVLTPLGRLLLARRAIEEDWSVTGAAEDFHVSQPTAYWWGTLCGDGAGGDGRSLQPVPPRP